MREHLVWKLSVEIFSHELHESHCGTHVMEGRVFAYMNTAPAQEMNIDYGVPSTGRPDR